MLKKQLFLRAILLLIFISTPCIAGQGTAIEFDGYNDYLEIPWSQSLNTEQFSICCWVKVNGNTRDNNQIIASSYFNDQKKGFLLVSSFNYKWQFWLGDGLELHVLNADGKVVTDQWTHLAATYDGNTMRIYVNGKLSGEMVFQNYVSNPEQSFLIGAMIDRIKVYPLVGLVKHTEHQLLGLVDELSVWNTVLSGQQIKSSMNTTLSGDESGLEAGWHFDEATGEIANDISGNGHHATLTYQIYITGDDETPAVWTQSNAPVGQGLNQTISGNFIDWQHIPDIGISVKQNMPKEYSLFATRINESPNSLPTTSDKIFDQYYWVLKSHPITDQSLDITFKIESMIDLADESKPERYKLYSRNIFSHKAWTFIAFATSASASEQTLLFEDISDKGQFIITKGDAPVIVSSKTVYHFEANEIFTLNNILINTVTTGDITINAQSNDETLIPNQNILINNVASPCSVATSAGIEKSLSITINPQKEMGNGSIAFYVNNSKGASSSIHLDFYVQKKVMPEASTAVFFDGFYDENYNDFVSRECSISISKEESFDFTDAMTIETWFKINKFELPWQTLISKGDTAWSLSRYDEENTLCFTTHGLSNEHLVGHKTINDGQWHHVAVVFDGQHKFMYVDGILDASIDATGQIQTNDYYVYLGSNSTVKGRYFNGSIDEMKIWNVPRTESQIRLFMHTTLQGDEPGLTAYYQFNASSGMIVYDVSSNLNNGEFKDNYPENELDFPQWIVSEIPVGGGISFLETIIEGYTGTWDAQQTDVTFQIYSITDGNDDIMVTLLQTSPELLPSNNVVALSDKYWIVEQFGEGDFDADLTFSIPGKITNTDYPEQFNLFYRPYNSTENWTLAEKANVIDFNRQTVTFPHIKEYGQFIIAKNDSSTDYGPGNSIVFDGIDDYVMINYHTSFDLTSSMTIEAWVKTNHINPSGSIIVSKNDKAWVLSIDPTTHAVCFKTAYKKYTFLQKTDILTGTKDIMDNEWHHIAAVYDKTNKYIYIDGNLDVSKSFKEAISTNDTDLYIGAFYDSDSNINSYYQGSIDEIRIWSMSHTQTQIRNMMHLCLKGDEMGLIAYWQFDEHIGSTVGDQSDNGHTAILMDHARENEDYYTPPKRELSTAPVIKAPENTKESVTRDIPQTYTGIVDFSEVNVEIIVNGVCETGNTVIIHMIEQAPDILPQCVNSILDDQFWMFDRFGEGLVDMNIVFKPEESLSQFTENQLSRLQLYHRNINDDSQWKFLQWIDSYNVSQNTLTFNHIQQFGQFIIGIADPLAMTVTITEPEKDAHLSDLIQIKGTAFSKNSLSHVQVQITDGTNYIDDNSMLIQTPVWITADGTENWHLNTSLVHWTEGTFYTIVAKAFDESDNNSHTSRTFGYRVKQNNIITCHIDVETFFIGEHIKVTGEIFPKPDLVAPAVGLKLISPDQQEYHISVLANAMGFFEFDLPCGLIHATGLWSLQTRWDGSETFKRSDSQVQTIHAKRSGTRLFFDISPHAIKQNDSIHITGKFLPDYHCGNSLENTSIVVSFAFENNYISKTVLTDSSGLFEIPSFNGLNRLGDWSVQASLSENQSYSSCVSEPVHAKVIESAGYAIVIQGSLEGAEGQAAYNKTTQKVVEQFKANKLLENDILLLQPDETGMANKSKIMESFTIWAVNKMNDNPANLYIVMVDHGIEDIFYVYPDNITANELSSWLDQLQNNLTGQAVDQEILLLLGFCHSGSFIDNISAPKRVIITSAASDELSFKGPSDMGVREGEYFVSEFLKQSLKGKSINWCFKEAVRQIEIFTKSNIAVLSAPFYDYALQHPLLDDNGDGIGSNDLTDSHGDGQLSDHLFIGSPPKSEEINALKTTETLFLNESQSSADFTISISHNDLMDRLWIEIKSPQEASSTQNTAQIEIPFLSFDYDTVNGHQYGFSHIDIFQSPGTYQVLYFVKYKTSGIISLLQTKMVYKAIADNNPPDPFVLKSPENESVVAPSILVGKNDYYLLMSWETAHDPDDTPITYSVILSDSMTFQYSASVYTENISEPMALVGIPQKWVDQDSDIFWKVSAIDTYGAFRDSNICLFHTKNGNPATGWVKGKVIDVHSKELVSTSQIFINQRPFMLSRGYYMGKSSPGMLNIKAVTSGYETFLDSSTVLKNGQLLEKNIYLTPNNVVMKGDITGDHSVNMTDAIAILKVLSHLPLECDINLNASISGDVYSLADIVMVLQNLSEADK